MHFSVQLPAWLKTILCVNVTPNWNTIGSMWICDELAKQNEETTDLTTKFQHFSTCLLSVWSVDFGIQFLSIWLGMCSFDYVVWVHFTYLSLAQIHLIYVKGCFSWIVLQLCDHHYVDLCYFGFKCLLWSYSEPFCDSVTITMYIAVSLSFSVPPSHMNLVIFMLHFLIY